MKVLALLFTWLLTWTLACCSSAGCGPELCGTGRAELDLGAVIQTLSVLLLFHLPALPWKQWFEAQLMTGD